MDMLICWIYRILKPKKEMNFIFNGNPTFEEFSDIAKPFLMKCFLLFLEESKESTKRLKQPPNTQYYSQMKN